MIAISVVRDEAAAELAREALDAVGIEVEIKRLGGNAYFGSMTHEQWEVRVPEDRQREAMAELDRLGQEVELAAIAEAGVPAGDDSDDLDEEQPRKIAWAIALGLLQPIPGAACMYARAFRVGLIVFGASIALFVAGAANLFDRGLEAWIGAKLLDLILAPFFVVQYNRSLARKKEHAARS